MPDIVPTTARRFAAYYRELIRCGVPRDLAKQLVGRASHDDPAGTRLTVDLSVLTPTRAGTATVKTVPYMQAVQEMINDTVAGVRAAERHATRHRQFPRFT